MFLAYEFVKLLKDSSSDINDIMEIWYVSHQQTVNLSLVKGSMYS